VDGEDEEAQTQHTKIVEKLHNILKPFLLRRLKADVFITLPMKKEIVLYPTMTPYQKKINEQLLDKTLIEEMKKLHSSDSSNVSKLRHLFMQMRKNTNHPDLITGEYDGSVTLPGADTLVEQCGKMKLFERLLKKLRKGNHKVLVFSQMTKMLDLLEVYLEDRGHKACRIDGGVPLAERKLNIDRFNKDPEYQYFLLSTRAGGLGINLASADTVIIYDSDWNPQQDMQAMDRCHRIGQTKPVLVFRLITANSVEEKMLAKAESKLKLERLVIKKGAFAADDVEKKIKFSVEEMKEILQSDVGLDKSNKTGDISDKDLNKLLDRSDLAKFRPIVAKKGKGFEVVAHKTGAGLLSNVNA
jgi:ATP-dependent DNA helicase